MREVVIEEKEAGQRLDKYLDRYLAAAAKSFLYKMMRKKNITLNGKKCEGSEKLQTGDVIQIFFSEETMALMTGKAGGETSTNPFSHIPLMDDFKSRILYEDENILLWNKPTGLLSQKAEAKDVSANEYILSYLFQSHQMTEELYARFHPGVCNRLDRNTSGLLIFGKSMVGLQTMAAMLKDRSLHKDYLCIVKGVIEKEQKLQGYLWKDERKNQVTILGVPRRGADPIETRYIPLKTTDSYTQLQVRLITGKSHQIRAHLSSVSHPILGDYKYGERALNEEWKKRAGLSSQLLHAWKLTFPKIEGPLAGLSHKTFIAPPPSLYQKIENSIFTRR